MDMCRLPRRVALHRVRVAMIPAMMLVLGGCTGQTTPPLPTAPTATSPQPSGSSAAVLVATMFTVQAADNYVQGQSLPRYSYGATLRLAEVSGLSGALVTSLALFYDGTLGGDYACLYNVNRIAPGGTWDMNSLSYCAPAPSADRELRTVSFEVRYIDDLGRAGKLVGDTIVSRP